MAGMQARGSHGPALDGPPNALAPPPTGERRTRGRCAWRGREPGARPQGARLANLNYGAAKIGEAAMHCQKFTTVSPTYGYGGQRPPVHPPHALKFRRT